MMESRMKRKFHVRFGERYEETRQPQGGKVRFVPTPLSPLLANIALHGMENEIKKLAESFDMRESRGKKMSMRAKRSSVSIIRYADDFVILHEDITIIQRCKEVISEWLKDMGLELKPSKTRLAHTLEVYEEEKPGFDFLGFNIRQFKVGKYTSGKNTKGKKLGFKTIITPSKEKQKRHYRDIAETIEKHRGQSQVALIRNLNPIIRGWCYYFSKVSSSKVFNRLKNLTYWKLCKWGKKRHRKKGSKWIRNKYFMNIDGDSWVFATGRVGKNPLRLLKHDEVKITRHVKVKGSASPYDGDLIYWSSRMGKYPGVLARTATLLKKQKGVCTHCGLFFKDGDVIELDHIIPKSKGGKNESKNWQLLHRHCHDVKTRNDGSLDRKLFDQTVKIPENYRWENDILVTC